GCSSSRRCSWSSRVSSSRCSWRRVSSPTSRKPSSDPPRRACALALRDRPHPGRADAAGRDARRARGLEAPGLACLPLAGPPLRVARRRADPGSPVLAGGSAAPVRRLACLLALATLALPATAFAHAGVVRTSPAYRQRLAGGPGRVEIVFDQRVTALPNAI